MYRSILVPIHPGHGEVGPRIISVAKLLAGSDGRVTLLTVLEPIPPYVESEMPEGVVEANRAKVADQLKDIARTAGLPEENARISYGAASRVILDTAEEIGADAIVIGSHRPQFGDFLIGSTAARVVRHAQCTVVVERSEAVTA